MQGEHSPRPLPPGTRRADPLRYSLADCAAVWHAGPPRPSILFVMLFNCFIHRSFKTPCLRYSRTAAMLLSLSLGVAGAAAAQSAPLAPVTGVVMPGSPSGRPASVAAGDMASRVLACTVCHGKEGRATPDGYFPRIAGKPAGYLANQLINFRDGRRSYPQMTYLIEHLTDAYLHEMAAHFAALELPYAPPPAPQAPAVALERGRLLVERGDAARDVPACVSRHGAAMTGVQPFIPGLLGLPRDYLNSQLGAWKTGQRRAQAPDCMAAIARKLTPDDVSAVSAWLAAQPVPGGGKPVAALPAPMPVRCGGVSEVSAASGTAGAALPVALR